MKHVLNGLKASLCGVILLAGVPIKAYAAEVTINFTGSVDIASSGPFVSYSATGVMYGDLTPTTLEIFSGTVNLAGAGPDTIMTITPGMFSQDGSGFYYDFGQGPFDIGVPAENPGYILNNTGFFGTLGDVFGSLVIGGSFDSEGFGLADPSSDSHSMSSFFWFGDSVEGIQPVPVPAAVWLFASGLLGLIGIARRT